MSGGINIVQKMCFWRLETTAPSWDLTTVASRAMSMTLNQRAIDFYTRRRIIGQEFDGVEGLADPSSAGLASVRLT